MFVIGLVACEQVNPPAEVVNAEPDITVPDPNYDDDDDDGDDEDDDEDDDEGGDDDN